MDARQYAPATARNREPILAVLQRVLPREGRVLELAAGSGEHAVFFAAAMPASCAALPTMTTSGRMPSCSKANSLPVRPRPV